MSIALPESKPIARPFLKWAGGKRRVLPELLPELEGPFNRYHEPFLGGGAVFFALRAQGPLKACLTDMNQRLVRTWRAIRDDTDDLLDRLAVHAERHCETHYYATRARDIDAETDDVEVAAWMIYLNRTGFNGLYRVNRKGGFNVPMGRYVNPRIRDEANILAVSEVLQDVDIVHGDFRGVIDRSMPGDLVYFDPPYAPLSSTSNFTAYTKDGFGAQDQLELADVARTLREKGVRVVLSNHKTDEVEALYSDFDIREIQVARAISCNAAGRGRVPELVITG